MCCMHRNFGDVNVLCKYKIHEIKSLVPIQYANIILYSNVLIRYEH